MVGWEGNAGSSNVFSNPLVLVLLLGGVAVLSWLAWISIQSLIQGRLLREAARRGGGVELEPGRRAAFYGPVRLVAAVRKPGLGDLLWCRCRTQELRGSGKHRGWKTVGDGVEAATFRIRVGGEEILMDGFPTEVQGKRIRTEYLNPGFLGLFHGNGDRRVTTQYLPVVPRVTVVGRLERRGEDWVLGKDPKVGLLLSPQEPGRAAFWEILKGILGLLGVMAAVAAGIVWYRQGR